MLSNRIGQSAWWKRVKPYIPLVVGVIAFVAFLILWDKIDRSTLKESPIFPPPAFNGMKFVYAMFVGSIVTTIYATFDYRNELREMSIVAEGSDGKTLITSAAFCLTVVISLTTLIVFGLLIFPSAIGESDPCNRDGYQTFIHAHDVIVGIIFLAFVVADILTLNGMRRAGKNIEDGIERLKTQISAISANNGNAQNDVMSQVISEKNKALSDLRDKRLSATFAAEFSNLQLRLIDVPVIIGLFLIFIITKLSTSYSEWNAEILKIDSNVFKSMADSRSVNLLSCNGTGISIYEFQQIVSGIFSAGIAMGFVAASVIMSQIIFIALNVMHDKKMIEVNKTGPADVNAAID